MMNSASKTKPTCHDQYNKPTVSPKGMATHRPMSEPRWRASAISCACSAGVRCAQISRTSGDWNGDQVDCAIFMACA